MLVEQNALKSLLEDKTITMLPADKRKNIVRKMFKSFKFFSDCALLAPHDFTAHLSNSRPDMRLFFFILQYQTFP